MDFEKFKTALKDLKEAVLSTEQKFKDVKLVDGVTIARYDGDQLIVGTPFNIVTDQGVQPAPDMEYTLEDGTVLTTVGGLVTEITPAAQEGPNAGADPNKTPNPNDMGDKPVTGAQAKAIVESIVKETRFAIEEEFKKQIAELKKEKEEGEMKFTAQIEIDKKDMDALKEQAEKQTKVIESMFKLLEQLSNSPSDMPPDPKNKPFNIMAFKKEWRNNLDKLHEQTN